MLTRSKSSARTSGSLNVRRDRDVCWPRRGEALEHRVAVRQDAVDGADERALLAHGEVPDEAHEYRACVALAQKESPQRLGELVAQLGLLELPRGGRDAILDEHVPEHRRVIDESALEQIELLLEGLHAGRVLEALDLVRRRFQRLLRVQIATQVLLRGASASRGVVDDAHLMISASQEALTLSIRFCNSGVSWTVSRAPGTIVATVCASPSMIMVFFSKNCGSSW